MLVIQKISEMPQSGRPIVLAMGCFDGVHIGHQKVISTAVEQAKRWGGDAWVYTFNPHPAKVLNPAKAPKLISAPRCRLRQFEALGIFGVIEIQFDTAFSRIESADFLTTLREGVPLLRGIVCGADWSFGYKAQGKFKDLEQFCLEHGLTATAISPVLFQGERVSSTHVRQSIREGDIPYAEQLLGRPFRIFGTVVPGRAIGRELGFPTANIEPENELIPAPGIYAAYTRIRGATEESDWVVRHPSAVFIGERKTFQDPESVIESYLLDFQGDLYGRSIEVCLVRKIRDVYPFPSREHLIAQIEKDILQVRCVLSGAEGA